MALASSSSATVRSSAATNARPVVAVAANSRAAVAAPAVRRALPASKRTPSWKSNSATISSSSTSTSTKAVASPITSPAPGAPQTIVFVSAEVAPFSKTGGLGDVLLGLPKELVARGHRVITIAPRYDQYAQAWDCGVDVPVGSDSVRFFHTRGKDNVERVFVDHPSFLAKVWGKTGAKLYGSAAGSDYADNQARFALFCRAALAAIDALPFVPGGSENSKLTIVANDWHSALIPVLIKDVEKPAGRFKNTKVALCIHNAAFQGRFHADSFGVLGLPAASKSRFDFEDGQPREFVEGEDPESLPAAPGKKFAKINWLKAGALAADAVLTVSPNYAREICSGPSGGVELDDVFRSVGVEGIVNGRNTPAPATAASGGAAASSLLPLEFDASTVAEGKAVAKETLQAELGLPVDPDAALFGFVGRLEEQKGVDVLLEAIPGLVKRAGGKKVQVAVLGTGKKNLEAKVSSLGDKYPGVASGTVAFSAPLAALITAGSDFFVVCSRQEPCGLVQLDAMARGTVPVVATVGGLVDTVKEGATGYHIGKIDPDGLEADDVEALAETLARAAAAHGTPAHGAMRDRCISQDLSWAKPAAKWEAVLEDLSSGGATVAETGPKKAAVTTPVAAV